MGCSHSSRVVPLPRGKYAAVGAEGGDKVKASVGSGTPTKGAMTRIGGDASEESTCPSPEPPELPGSAGDGALICPSPESAEVSGSPKSESEAANSDEDGMAPGKWMDKEIVPEFFRQRRSEISDTAQRGISLQQLQDLGSLVEKIVGKFNIKNRDGEAQDWDSVNLYTVCEHFVLPLTKDFACAFVELVATAAQVPTWFVSHWWGTPLQETLEMLKFHAEKRGVAGNFYWVCTFANNQHNLGELQGGLDETPFMRVLRSPTCHGTVALMDENCTPFTRIWCVLECFVSNLVETEIRDFSYDIATARADWPDVTAGGHVSVGLEGPGLDRGAALFLDGGGEIGAQLVNGVISCKFPSLVAQKGVRADVLVAEASKPKDKEAIMAHIAGQEQDLNAAVRRRFAVPAMVAAAAGNDTAELQWLLENFGDQKDAQRKANGVTPVWAAVQARHKEALEQLLKAGANPNVTSGPSDVSGDKPAVYFATEQQELEVLQMLLDARADPDKPSQTRVIDWQKHGALHDARADPDSDSDSDMDVLNFESKYTTSLTPLCCAASQGFTRPLQMLLDAGADPNAPSGEEGETSVFIATGNNQMECLKLLLKARADANKARLDGANPLMLAAQNNTVQAVEALLSANADPEVHNKESGATPLRLASFANSVDALRVLLAAGADANATGTGYTPTYHATEKQQLEVLQMLLDARADPDQAVEVTMQNGMSKSLTPLCRAADLGLTGPLQMLLDARADANAATAPQGETPVFLATDKEDVECLKLLLKARGDANKARLDTASPLMLAAQLNNVQAVEALLSANADLEARNSENGATALFLASFANSVDALRVLLTAGADANAVGTGVTPVYHTTEKQKLEALQMLLDARADPDKAVEVTMQNGASTSATALCTAAQEPGLTRPMQMLLEAGANVNKARSDGFNPLMMAAVKNNVPAIEALLAANADLEMQDEDGFSPLMLAVHNNSFAATQALLAANADLEVQDEDGYSALTLAAQKNHVPAIEALLAANAHLEVQSTSGATPLVIAGYCNSINAVRVLLAAGADANATLPNGETPVLNAIANNNMECLHLLLAARADANKARVDGGSPLMVATGRNDVPAVEALLFANADLEARDQDGATPLLIASMCNSVDALRVLLAAGADANRADGDGFSPLMRAAQNNNVPASEALLAANADLEAKDEETGATALFLASLSGSVDALRVLLAAGADANTTVTVGYTPAQVAKEGGHTEALALLLQA